MAFLRPQLAESAESWPVTEFEVFPGPPSSGLWGDNEQAAYLDFAWSIMQSEDFKQAKELESALSRAARKFESMGFPPPTLEPIITRADGTRAYRVYVCQQSWISQFENAVRQSTGLQIDVPTLRSLWDDCGAIAAHVGDCGSRGSFANYLYFNDEKIFAAPYLRGVDYATITHELFHTVHASMASGRGLRGCQAGAWINEGLADAVSLDLARELWPGISYKGLDDFPGVGLDKEYGIRAYWRPLTHRFKEAGENSTHQYFSSSFWRYIGEWYHAGASNEGRRAGSSQSESNYRFLKTFLDRPFQGAPGSDSELRWLEEGLKNTPKIATTLARAYSEFIAAFADMVRTRIAPGYGGTAPKQIPQGRLDNFLKAVFASCTEVELSPVSPVAVEQFVLAPVSAACAKVTVKQAHGSAAPKQVAIEISAGPKPREDLTPIWIGKSGGMEVSQLMVFSSKERSEAPSFGTASIKLDVGKTTVLVISNVAEDVTETRMLSPVLTFMLGGWDSTMTRPPAKKKVPTRKQARPDDARGEHEKALDEEFEEGIGQLTSNGQFSTRMNKLGESRDCRGKEQQYNLCGPQLEIELELTPAAGTNFATSTTGGFLNQQRAGGVGRFQQMNLAELNAMFELKESMEPSKIEGGQISIFIPDIEYGFSGTVDNALISVSREGGGTLRSRTPTAVAIRSSGFGEPVRRRVPNGKVTIRQYTPLTLYGEFEASLLDRDPERPYYKPNEAIPVAGQVRGHFVVSNPFNDDEFSPDQESFEQQMGLDIIEQVTPSDEAPRMMGPEAIKELCAMGVDVALLQGIGIEGGCGAVDGGPADGESSGLQCDCSCEEYAGPASEQCSAACETQYSACASMDGDPQMARLKKLLKASGLPPLMHEQYIADFGTMSTTDREALLNMLELITDQQ